MALYGYLKVASKPKKPKRHLRFLSLGLIGVGLILIGNAVLPIFIYQVKSERFQNQIVAPVDSFYIDYTNPSNWFPTAPTPAPRQSKITHYNLSIPKLKIENAIVEIGGNDLERSLIHYPGTALPGQFGNVVVFGHSVLPQFYNPKNYKTIFSTLPTLKQGDEILVDFDGVLYRYLVVQMIEVQPKDVSVLEQQYNGEYLSLITCVPPGTYLRRLVVRTKLVSF